MSGEFDHIRERLESIAEELADLGMEHLRNSMEEGGENYGDAEKRIGKARRAVEKAIVSLRGPVESDW